MMPVALDRRYWHTAAMVKMRIFSFGVLLGLVGFMASGILLAEPVAKDMTLDAAARAEVIDGALKVLSEGYVFPDVAKQMEQAIRARQQR